MATHLGIDFGTSNSHVALCHDQGEGPLVAVAIKFAGKASIATCVLWGRAATEGEAVEAFGTVAVETWSQFDAEERSGRRIALGFKPDLARSERARADAAAFLGKIREAVAEVQPAVIRSGEVVVGVPAEIGETHRRLTAEIARAAGFAGAACVDEPLAALAYHLNNGTISPAAARAGVVVIDFGGGTFDVALVSAGQGLRAPWGDPALGGRLFDDLFFQWVQDQNLQFEVDEREAMVVWQQECREMKEAFSRRWSAFGDEMKDFKYRITVGDRTQSLKNASVAEFLCRARSYRPSKIAARYFRDLGMPAPLAEPSAADGAVDLLAWVRETMARKGGVDGAADWSDVKTVILTGGSSEWPFVRTIAAEIFGVDPAEGIIRSDDPEMTIGSGLALYMALKARNARRRARIALEAPKARDAFVAAISARLDGFAGRAAQAIVDAVMPRVEEAYRAWYRDGGSLRSVEEKVARICAEFESEAAPLAQAEWRMLDIDLLRMFRDHARAFLRTHEIDHDVSRYIPDSVSAMSLAAGGRAGDAVAAELGGLAQRMTAVAGGIGTVVAATLHLKVMVLVALAHPILAVVLGIGTLLTYLGVSSAMGSAVEAAVKNHDFNLVSRTILHIAFSEAALTRKLDEGREAVLADLKRDIAKTVDETSAGGARGIVAAAAAAFDAVTRLAIADLGVLEEVGKGISTATGS